MDLMQLGSLLDEIAKAAVETHQLRDIWKNQMDLGLESGPAWEAVCISRRRGMAAGQTIHQAFLALEPWKAPKLRSREEILAQVKSAFHDAIDAI